MIRPIVDDSFASKTERMKHLVIVMAPSAIAMSELPSDPEKLPPFPADAFDGLTNIEKWSVVAQAMAGFTADLLKSTQE